MNKGTIAQVIGPVVDVDFNEGEIPTSIECFGN